MTKEEFINTISLKKINGIKEDRIKHLLDTEFQDAEGYEIRIILSYIRCYVHEFETLFNLEL